MGTTLLAINQRHERLIDGLLTLASSEQDLTQAERVDLADIAGHLLAQAESRDLDIRSDLQPAVVAGDPVLLERLVANLIDNAVRYNLPDGGFVMVSTRMVGGHAELTVENSGLVIAGYEVPGLFEPFRRLNGTDRQTSQGTGLGLSIVRAVAHAHGGDVHTLPRADGGLTITVRIPALADAGTAGMRGV